MSWLDELIPAALNGVPIFIESASKSGGRRTRAHEFADVDGAWVEDSGGVPHRYDIDAFLVGDEYHVTLQALEEVLDAPGPMELEHPKRGRIGGLYLDGTYSTQESKDRGGFAQVTFTLVQGGRPEPLIFDSLPSKIKVTSQRVRSAASAQLRRRYSGRDLFGTSLRRLRRVSNALTRSYGKAMAALGPISEVQGALESLASSVGQIVNLPDSIASVFREFARSFMGLFAKKAKDLGRPESAPRVLADAAKGTIDANKTPEAVSDYDSVVGSDETPIGKALVAKTDLDAFDAFWGATIVAALAEVAVDLPLPNADAAEQLANLIDVEIDALLAAEVGAGPIGSDLYDALLDLKVQISDILSEIGGQLPVISTYTPPTSVPLVIAAYHQSGATGKALSDLVKSILEINPMIEDPLWILDGEPIKVLA